jgi:hypothetical protein
MPPALQATSPRIICRDDRGALSRGFAGLVWPQLWSFSRFARSSGSDVHLQGLPAPRQRAEVRHRPIQTDQPKHALDEPGCLSQCHPEQHLLRQTGLRRRSQAIGHGSPWGADYSAMPGANQPRSDCRQSPTGLRIVSEPRRFTLALGRSLRKHGQLDFEVIPATDEAWDGLAREKWRAPTEEPGGVLWETGIDRRRSFGVKRYGWR